MEDHGDLSLGLLHCISIRTPEKLTQVPSQDEVESQ